MPNHIINRLIMQGAPLHIADIKNLLKGKPYDDGTERLIDFNKLVPRPEIIEQVGEINHAIVTAVKNKYKAPLNGSPIIAMLEYDNRQKIKLEHEYLPAFELACKAYEQTGYCYWYDWNVANWGTKWNAYEVEENTPDNILIFHTAWSHVLKLIELLSKKFPHVEFLYAWADSYNCGHARVKNGEVVINTPTGGSVEAYELAFELRPDIKENYKLVNGNYINNDEDEDE